MVEIGPSFLFMLLNIIVLIIVIFVIVKIIFTIFRIDKKQDKIIELLKGESKKSD